MILIEHQITDQVEARNYCYATVWYAPEQCKCGRSDEGHSHKFVVLNKKRKAAYEIAHQWATQQWGTPSPPNTSGIQTMDSVYVYPGNYIRESRKLAADGQVAFREIIRMSDNLILIIHPDFDPDLERYRDDPHDRAERQDSSDL